MTEPELGPGRQQVHRDIRMVDQSNYSWTPPHLLPRQELGLCFCLSSHQWNIFSQQIYQAWTQLSLVTCHVSLVIVFVKNSLDQIHSRVYIGSFGRNWCRSECLPSYSSLPPPIHRVFSELWTSSHSPFFIQTPRMKELPKIFALQTLTPAPQDFVIHIVEMTQITRKMCLVQIWFLCFVLLLGFVTPILAQNVSLSCS